MRAILAVAATLVLSHDAIAAPSADVVVYWAPADVAHRWRDEARGAAQRAGAAFVDRSPAAPEPPSAPALVTAGITAYTALRFDDAVAVLDRAAAEIDVTGAAGLSAAELADLFLYRGLARFQRGEPAAWDDLVVSARIDPARVLDPTRFPPRAIEQLQRARSGVTGEPRVDVTVISDPDCAVALDATAITGGRGELAPGEHWLRVTCPGRGAAGRRIRVSAPGVTVELRPPAITPPDDDEALIQARTAGSEQVIDVVVAGGVARARLRHVGGRELGRRSLALTGARPGALAAAITALLVPPVTTRPAPRHWYRSRWVWAAGGALAAAAVLVPIALGSSDGERDVVVRPTGWPPW